MRKILVLAYAISPSRGSEYSVAWNYVVNMSKNNQLTVLYGTSGDHIGDFQELNNFFKINSIPNTKFIAIKPTKFVNTLNILNKKNIFSYSFYFAFKLWHKHAYRYALKLLLVEQFDIIHYIVPIGYREPGYLWKLNLPYIWGPIGGTSNISFKLSYALDFLGLVKLGFRTIANTIQLKFKSNIRKAIKTADVIIASTIENKLTIDKTFKTNSLYIPENGISTELSAKNHSTNYNKIKLIWIGRIDSAKGLIILLKSLIHVKDLDKFEVHIVGDGPLKSKLETFSIKNNINKNIIWHGKVDRLQVFNLISSSDLHIITSLKEANTTVVFETLSYAIPTMTIDHCGMSDTITNECGIKIPLNSFKQIITDIAEQLNRISLKEIDLDLLAQGAYNRASLYTWDKRIDFFEEIYQLAINRFKVKKNDYNNK